ncbi:hypothetical protein DFH05DRAFT_945388 [Lentinula detonsa]|uniref:F-box domain-containing protein n=1 Tax=Lentinula detonsa TaxID=2804962 RepID=A0A9W8TZK1_9AGAR|nr:hypothetical protein DFH05DRAFT_945388 [Lentinula detonsa]
MASPIYTAFSSPANILSLPLEVTEQILVACAFSPETIASFSRTCRLYHELIYGGTDNHLWREIYLTTFDDPRPKLNMLKRPIVPYHAEEANFDWRIEFQLRFRAEKLCRGSTVDSRGLSSKLNVLSSTATSVPPHVPETMEYPATSANISWLRKIFARGFPPALLRRLTLSKSDDALSVPQQDIMHPGWELSAAGRAFYKLFFLTGLHPASALEHRNEEERYHLRSKRREVQDLAMSEAKQRALARTVARHRVYNLPYLSGDRCWGPFLPTHSPPPSSDDDNVPSATASENGKGKGKEKEALVAEDSHATLVEDPKQRPKRKGRGRTADSSHDTTQGIVQYYTESDTEEHSEDESEQGTAGGALFFVDQGDENGEDPFAPAPGPLPIFPPRPDLVYPDWAFLSAARLVITENLRERYGSDIPMWPWFTTVAAVQATREILLRMGVPLPSKLNSANGEDSESGEDEDDDGENVEAKTGGDNIRNESRSGIEALRMGSAPGFWTGRGTKEGWTGIKSDVEEKELSKPWKIDKDVEFVDGWDWAGAEGRWMRAVCWMDYRDLLFHNLQTTYPTVGYRHEIEETCRVFPMTLRVVGFSRVSPPLALPSSSSFESCASTKSSPGSNEQGKGKAKDLGSPGVTYDPLVYALPVIHVVGEFRGSDVDESVARRARGTIRMIGDRAIRWNLISSEVSTPDRDEWVMEGVQVGEIGSAMGVVGMWTGAQHERGDPIGPSWAWKME